MSSLGDQERVQSGFASPDASLDQIDGEQEKRRCSIDASRVMEGPPDSQTREASQASSSGTGLVELAGTRVPLIGLRRAPSRYSRLFATAKAHDGYGLCLCTVPPARLVIRARQGRYHLAGWPGEGDRHAVGCDFRKDVQLSGRSVYAAEAIKEIDQQTVVRLAIPLHVRPGGTTSVQARSPDIQSPPSPARRSVGLLGMLHLLWQTAGLSEWLCGSPQRRTWHDCQPALQQEAGACLVNGISLSEALYIVPPYLPKTAEAAGQAFDHFCAALSSDCRTVRRGLILGEIRVVSPTKYGYRIALRHHRAPVFVETELLTRVARSYRAAFAANLPDHARKIMLAVIERTARGNLRAIDMAVMLTNGMYVPAESSHEVRMADHLIAAGRIFTKPLRYEAGDAVFPDFILVDVEPRVCVEVYGVHGMQAYDERRRLKQVYYAQAGMPVLAWDVRDPLPEIPAMLAAGV